MPAALSAGRAAWFVHQARTGGVIVSLVIIVAIILVIIRTIFILVIVLVALVVVIILVIGIQKAAIPVVPAAFVQPLARRLTPQLAAVGRPGGAGAGACA